MGRMSQLPYESPCEDNRVKQRFPWKWMLAAGLLTSMLGYLAIVALILSNETPTGMRVSLPIIAASYLFAGLMGLGAVIAIIGGIGWLVSWFRP
jgi:hypothetical protein